MFEIAGDLFGFNIFHIFYIYIIYTIGLSRRHHAWNAVRWIDNPNHKKPCICLTANAGEGAREKYLSLGFDDYMAKQVSGIALEKMIMAHMPKEKIEKK